MLHKYRLKQLVRFVAPYSWAERSKDIYEVTRLMPADQGGELSYRIKSSTAGERAVRESEITPRNAPADQLENAPFG